MFLDRQDGDKTNWILSLCRVARRATGPHVGDEGVLVLIDDKGNEDRSWTQRHRLQNR